MLGMGTERPFEDTYELTKEDPEKAKPHSLRHACVNCNKAYRHPQDLKRHSDAEHNGVKFYCKIRHKTTIIFTV